MNLAIIQFIKLFSLSIFCTALLFSAPVLSLDTDRDTLTDDWDTATAFLSCLLFTDCPNSSSKGVKAFESKDYATAIEELLPLADNGNPVAQFYVAKMNYNGFGVPKDLDIAFARYKESAEQGYSKAQHNLSFFYIYGETVEKDEKKGFDWMAKAADQGFHLSQYYMGIALSLPGSPLEKNISKALEYFMAAADQNYPPALTRLGAHFAQVDIDYEKADSYLKQAAALGDAEAMWRLSFSYMSGNGNKQNKTKAFDLLKSAAEKKYLPSYYDLGVSYLWGNGVDRNVEAGISWLQQSAVEANEPRAMEGLAQLQINYRDGYLASGVAIGSISSGIDLRKKAADLGDGNAQMNLFIHYNNGDHLPVDNAEATKWLKLAAESGHVDAQYELGRRYFHGFRIEKDQDKAITWYEKASDSGHMSAREQLGILFLIGEDVKQDLAKAMYWLSPIAEDSELAAMLVGQVYMQANPPDREKAEMWLRKSGKEGKYLMPLLYFDKQYGTVDLDKSLLLAQEVLLGSEGAGLAHLQSMLAAVHYKKENWKESRYWFAEISQSEQGSYVGQRAEASLALGAIFLFGINVDQDITEAIRWLTRADEQGNVDAAPILGVLFLGGLGERLEKDVSFQIDVEKGIRWFSKAAEQGNIEAHHILAWMYLGQLSETFKGVSLPTDLGKGIRWLRKAAEQGDAESQVLLGGIYLWGLNELFSVDVSFQTDLDTAKYWFSAAARQGSSDGAEGLAAVSAEVEKRKAELARIKELERKAYIAKLERAQRERRALEAEIAEYKSRQAQRAARPARPSFFEVLIGSVVQGLGQALETAVTVKVEKALGVSSGNSHSARFNEHSVNLSEIEQASRRGMRRALQQQQIMKNLRTPASVGYNPSINNIPAPIRPYQIQR